MTAKDKKFNLLDQPCLTLTVKAYRTRDPETGRGVCWFGMADDIADVLDDDGNEIGSCGGRMGGVYCFSVKETPLAEDFWAIPVQELWGAFDAAFKERLATGIGAAGVRHPDAPCDDFAPGNPYENGGGDCIGDGHYFCRACSRLTVEDDEPEDDEPEDDEQDAPLAKTSKPEHPDAQSEVDFLDGEVDEDAHIFPAPTKLLGRIANPEEDDDWQTARGRWVAYETPDVPLRSGSLPYFGMVLGDTVYHDGGPSRMSWSDEFTVLKEYGEHTNEEAGELGLESRFMSDFPPLAGTAADAAERGSAWISPGGTIYACGYMQHTALAERIANEEGYKTAGLSDDGLVQRGWVRLYVDLVGYHGEPTQRQLDALWDIAEACRQKPGPHNSKLLKAIEGELER